MSNITEILTDASCVEVTKITSTVEVIDEQVHIITVGSQGPAGPQGEVGPQGIGGISAYEVAVEQGFVGDETDWLASLVGADGPQGMQGPPGVDGVIGHDGLSAYEIAIENGFQGDEAAWLASLVGADGADGPQGIQGIQGLPGVDGDAADTAAVTHAATLKDTPVDADEIPIVDSEASNILKKLTWSNLKTKLKTYLDTLYSALGHTHAYVSTINSVDNQIARFDGVGGAIQGGDYEPTISDEGNVSIAPTWNNAGSIFTGLKVNATDTASSASSNLLDLQVGGTSKFKIDKTGYVSTVSRITCQGQIDGNQLAASSNAFYADTSGVGIKSAGYLAWSSGTSGASNIDLKLYRDAANTLSQRNSTTAQIHRIYNTYTDASNYERLSIGWSSNTVSISPEAAGTGSVRQLAFPLGTVVADTPLSITQTWNNATIAFTGLKLNVTDTASSASSNLLDLQVGGASRFKVDKSGTIYTQTYKVLYSAGPNTTYLCDGTNAKIQLNANGVRIPGIIELGGGTFSGYSCLIAADSAGALAFRDGVNAQTHRIYNTYTDASNYERLSIGWSSNIVSIGPEAAGTGTVRQLAFTLGTVTADTPLSITQTWNNAAVAFTGLKLNVTDTASSSSSLLVDLQIGATSKFKIDKNGSLISSITSSSIPILSAPNFSILNNTYFAINCNGIALTVSRDITNGLRIGSDMPIGWSSSADAWTSAADVRLYRDAAGVLAQRNSTNAQTYRIYNTYTNASNYERGTISWGSNLLTIGTEAAGTGLQRNLRLQRETGNYLQLTDLGLDVAQTWNAVGSTFTGLKLNVTNTASATGSTLFDIQVGGTSALKLTPAGVMTLGTGSKQLLLTDVGSAADTLIRFSNTTTTWYQGGGAMLSVNLADGIGILGSTYLTTDTSHVLAQRYGTTAQTYRIYNTYTNASNYERGTITWGSNLLTIGTEAAGTGTNRDLEFNVGGSKLHIKTDGTIYLDAAGQTAGNARGAGAVDLQVGRNAATKVASGAYSALLGGYWNTVAGSGSGCFAGYNNSVSANQSACLGGMANSVTGIDSACIGGNTNVCSYGASAIIGGTGSTSSQYVSATLAPINNRGAVIFTRSIQTTDATQVELLQSTYYGMVLAAKSIATLTCLVGAYSNSTDGYKAAGWEVKVVIAKAATGNIRIVGTPIITQLAADVEAIAGGWTLDCAVSSNSSTDYAFVLRVTGEAATTINWNASFFVAYATPY